MRKSTYMMMAALPLLWATNNLAAEERIQLGPHVHGHGKLDMALEGKRLEMELNSPGMDIVGFEHEAHSDKDKAALAKARKDLANGMVLFGLPDGAKCKQLMAKVEIVKEAHHHEHEEDHDKVDDHHADNDHDEDHDRDEQEMHDAFKVHYQFECAAPDQLTSMHPAPFFARFVGSKELDVTFVTAKRQQGFEVKRDHPMLEGMKP